MDAKESRVTIEQEDKPLELWNGKKSMIFLQGNKYSKSYVSKIVNRSIKRKEVHNLWITLFLIKKHGKKLLKIAQKIGEKICVIDLKQKIIRILKRN